MEELDKHLLDDFQRNFPLISRPFAAVGRRLGVSEERVMQALNRLRQTDKISRVGPVFTPRKLGASTLAAMVVPAERLEAVAALVNDYSEVNHNYEREHRFNLWFVVIAHDHARLQAVLDDIEARSGLAIMSLPLITNYHIDLGFRLEL